MNDTAANRRILIVDDEKAFARTLAKRIAMRSYSCDVAHDGRTALEMLAVEAYEAVLLDLRLPDLHGKQILPLALAARPGIPVIIITAHGNDADEADCRELGAVGFFHKPVKLARLMRILGNLTAGAR